MTASLCAPADTGALPNFIREIVRAAKRRMIWRRLQLCAFTHDLKTQLGKA